MSRLLEITEKGLADFRIAQTVNVDKRACRIGAIIPKHPETGGPMRTHRMEFSGRDAEIRRRKFQRDPFFAMFGMQFGRRVP